MKIMNKDVEKKVIILILLEGLEGIEQLEVLVQEEVMEDLLLI